MKIYQLRWYFLCVLFISSSNSARVSLAGDDWSITDNQNHTATGHVPGTIHTILLNEDKIPDPYMGNNDVDLRYLIWNDWVFTKTFQLSSDFLASDKFMLHFEQIDTVANITINECSIGTTNSMFVPYTFNISKNCLKAKSEIQVYFESPLTYALKQAIAYNDSVLPNCTEPVQNGECHVQFIRKEPCSFSWDWGPAFAPIGIPGDIYLESINNTEIIIELDSINVASYIESKRTWQVDVMLSSDNSPFKSELLFTLETTAWSYNVSVSFNRNVSLSVFIPDELVLRWWPNGYGNQTLYTFTVFNQGTLVGSRIIGFRTVQLIQHEYGEKINGTSFYFAINSVPVYVKGSNWIPSDSFQERVSDEKLERLLRSAQLANMNMLRIWGGGIYERNSFYEMTDRLGIMLWHDFMFACNLYPVDEPFLTNVYNEVIYQVKRLQSHASIVIWAGNNENEAAVAQNWYRVPDSEKERIKAEYRILYVGTVMNAVKQVDKGDNRPFVTSSPSNGLESITENYTAQNPQDPLYGDVHFYGYHDDPWDPTTYPITRFLSETGIQSLPSLDTWLQITNDSSELSVSSPLVVHREHSNNQLIAMMSFVAYNLPLPVTNDSLKNFTQLIYLSQIHQAMTLKSISDHCRLHSTVETIDPTTSLGHTMGLMYWQINDIWQAPTWATIEYGLKWKMGHYFVRHMYAPVYPIVKLTPYLSNVTNMHANLSLYIVNELITGVHAFLTCSIYKLDTFLPKASFETDVTFDSPGLQNVMTLPYASLMNRANCKSSTECIVHCSLNYDQNKIGQTLFLTRPKNYPLQNPNLQKKIINGTSTTDIDIVISADRPALFVWLDVSTNVAGYFSRNGFNMFEESMTVTFRSWTPLSSLDRSNFDISLTSLYDIEIP